VKYLNLAFHTKICYQISIPGLVAEARFDRFGPNVEVEVGRPFSMALAFPERARLQLLTIGEVATITVCPKP